MNGLATPPLLPLRSNSFPSNPLDQPPFSRRSTPSVTPVLRSFDARNVSVALAQGQGESTGANDWMKISIQILPLFNGENYRGNVEDLNELVNTHVQRTISRAARLGNRQATSQADIHSLATGLLIGDLSELIMSGCRTLSAGLLNVSGNQLLTKLNEIWIFFWTGVLPSLEAIFVFLRCDSRLKASTVEASDGWLASEEGTIDIRRLALIAFRDHVIMPRIDELAGLFQDLYVTGSSSSSESASRSSTPPLPPIQFEPSSLSPTQSRTFPSLPLKTSNIPSPLSDSGFSTHNPAPSSPPIPSPIPIPISIPNSSTNSNFSTPRISTPLPQNIVNNQGEHARRRQLINVLASVLTDDDRQIEMDSLLRMMRLGSTSSGGRPVPRRSWTNGVSNLDGGVDSRREMDEGLIGAPFSQDSSQFTSSSVQP